MALLDRSISQNAVLMQSEYKIGGESFLEVVPHLESGRRTVEAYRLLRIACQDIIGQLPKLTSLGAAISLKEKRQKDIVRLRSVLAEIESELRTGEVNAMRSAAKAVRLAVRDLNRGNIAQKISKWTTYLSVPSSAAELLLALPPIAGITLALSAASTQFASKRSKKKNDWVQVVR